eukprot:6176846-Pleurochrysis_carterae.AAC.5
MRATTLLSVKLARRNSHPPGSVYARSSLDATDTSQVSGRAGVRRPANWRRLWQPHSVSHFLSETVLRLASYPGAHAEWHTLLQALVPTWKRVGSTRDAKAPAAEPPLRASGLSRCGSSVLRRKGYRSTLCQIIMRMGRAA